MVYRPGDALRASDVNFLLNGVHSLSDIREELDNEDTFVIELVPGVRVWNSRSVEISMDSHAYHRLVAQTGEKGARNSLMPLAQSDDGEEAPYSLKETSCSETVDGLELANDNYPKVSPPDYTYKTTDSYQPTDDSNDEQKFTFLCSQEDAGESEYFTNLTPEFENGYNLDQYIPGKVVYVYPSKTGYVLTPTKTDQSTPCIIQTSPMSAAWRFNTAVYTSSSEEETKSRLKEIKAQIVQDRPIKGNYVDIALTAFESSKASTFDERAAAGCAAYSNANGSINAAETSLLKGYFSTAMQEITEKCYRFDNRIELLTSLAQGLLERHLGYSFAVRREKATPQDSNNYATAYDTENHNIISLSSLRDQFSNSLTASYKERSGSPVFEETTADWLAIVTDNLQSNSDLDDSDALDVAYHAAEAIRWWLCNGYDVNGRRIPVSFDDPKRIQYLACLVNKTYALAHTTALLMTVTTMVPGKKYSLYIDPKLTKAGESAESALIAGDRSLIWDGNRLIPYSEETKANKDITRSIVESYNAKVKDIDKALSKAYEGVSKEAADLLKLSVAENTPYTFRIADRVPTGQQRKSQATSTASFVAQSLQKEVFGGDTSVFGIAVVPLAGTEKADRVPWQKDCREITLSFFEVDPEISQGDWLKLLYCTPDKSSISVKRIYDLFGGKDSVPVKNGGFLTAYTNTLDKARRSSRFVQYDGVLNTKTGQFWCSDTHEIYSIWYDISTQQRIPGPYLSDAEGVNVLYTHRIQKQLFGSQLRVEPLRAVQDGTLIGYVLQDNQSGLLFADTDEGASADVSTEPVRYQIPGVSFESEEGEESYKKSLYGLSDVAPGTAPVTFVEPSSEPVEKVTDPALSDDLEMAEVFYDPPSQEVSVSVQEKSDKGIVRLPITSLLLPDLETKPNMDAPFNVRGDNMYKGTTVTTLDGTDTGNKKFAEYPIKSATSVGYSYLVAKNMGLVEPEDSIPTYQHAYYAAEDTSRPFCRVAEIAVPDGETSVFAEVIKKVKQSSWESVTIKKNIELRSRRTVSEGVNKATYLCFGTYRVKDRKEPEKIYLDLMSSSKELYAQSVVVSSGEDGGEDTGFAHFVPYYRSDGKTTTTTSSSSNSDSEGDSEGSSSSNTQEPSPSSSRHEDTCGWVEYRYYDEVPGNQKPESITLSVPNEIRSLTTISGRNWVVDGMAVDPVWFTPFWYAYGLNYGYATTHSIDRDTKKATIYFYSYLPSNGSMPSTPSSTGSDDEDDGNAGDDEPSNTDDPENQDEPGDGNDDNSDDGEEEEQSTVTKPGYDQYHSFPFLFESLPPAKRVMVTTKTYKAQRSDWVPALCRELDSNEVLIPGMVVDITAAKTNVNTSVFEYLTVNAPAQYTTPLEGTPRLAVYKINYRKPSVEETEKEVIGSDDCWITNITKLGDDDPVSLNPKAGTVYRFGVRITSEGTPDIREPFGAFNDCANKGSLTPFLRTTAWGISFTCSARLDFVPFGYAVPSKTPSCYYKVVNDPCAVSMVSRKYLVKRMEGKLYLTGACYVPCSTLTSFN